MNSIVSAIARHHRVFHGQKPYIIVSAPACLDLLNTHQDYKGLPVVLIGINLRCYIAVSRVDSKRTEIVSLDLFEEGLEYRDVFYVENPELFPFKWYGNYFRAVYKVLKDKGFSLSGLRAVVKSQIPMGCGLASSTALLIAFIGALNKVFELGLDRKEIAELAYHIEHDVMHIPCSKIKHYGSSFGGLMKINTRQSISIEELPRINGVFVIFYSGMKRSILEIVPRRLSEIDEGLNLLMQMNELPESIRRLLDRRYDRVEWDKLDLNLLKEYIDRLPDKPRKRILFTILENESTKLALDIIKGREVSVDELTGILGVEWKDSIEKAYHSPDKISALTGIIMSYQHSLLRDLYDVSLPEIEKVINNIFTAGAFGAKLSGIGLGGPVIALVEDHSEAEEVLKAGIMAGAKGGWIVDIDDGIRIEEQ